MGRTNCLRILFIAGLIGLWPSLATAQDGPGADKPQPARVALREMRLPDAVDPAALSRQVTIYRDQSGVPHIDGKTDQAAVFGFAYAQAEDFFWQVEDTYILALGRYSEVHGPRGLNSDLLNRAFEVVSRSKADFAKISPKFRSICEAFAAGLNFYLANHPEVKPRLIQHFEPWHVLAFQRHMSVELCYRYTHLSKSFMPRQNKKIWAATGSNGWVISGKRTRSGSAMLMANPHLPWFGFAQMYEAQLRSDEGLNFTGATFYGSPLLTIGHNEFLGWTMTTNEPDVADVWRVTFDDPEAPLNYRYGDGYRTATEWKETIRILTSQGVKEEVRTFRKTHHGPIVEKEDDQTYLAAQISALKYGSPVGQSLMMAKARNLEEFKEALGMMQMPIMNILYGDREGNILFVYNAIIPRRDPQFNWAEPVDGSDPRTEWQGVHPLSDLPQVLNPPSGFIQNCNSSPFTTSDDGNPDPNDFPSYMIEDKHEYKRRAMRSREMLREMVDITYEDLQIAAFDTEIYWARHQLPEYAKQFEKLKTTNPKLAQKVEPFIKHLLDWDYRVTVDSTQATLCEAWYENLYGTEYPGEQLKDRFVDNPELQFETLMLSASQLNKMHGSWKVPYGDVHRSQRVPYTADLLQLHFDDNQPSLPNVGAHGPMGVINTEYYTPSIHIPFVMSQKKRYGVVGATYLGVYEFGKDGIRSSSLVHFGQNGNPESPHFFDQAQLLAESRLKPVLFTQGDIAASTVRTYHPGDRSDPVEQLGVR